MKSKARVAGHPAHPMLVVIPLGLFTTAAIFDAIYLMDGPSVLSVVVYWNIVAGILGGLIAAVPGAIDWRAIPAGTRAKRIGALHGISNVIVVVLFALSAYLRSDNANYAPSVVALVFSYSAIGLAIIAGWLGGELVDRLGVGVDEGAHLNAPSSLTNESAGRSFEAGRPDPAVTP